ncbi:hypothetical protein C2S52_006681 [Perilla frutescens var. hirtella]|nr:hypothetical protein C2S51_009032 [Perilla frutescens var. frutescens]KAH6787129.1 hypothetical protein C2S52_006681 [Perilla frutescens var. hirtella]
MKSAIRISALLWADILVGYAMFVMQDYLTDVWGLSFTHAAAILNIWNGISFILQPLFLFFVVDAFLGNFGMLVISSTTYTLGIFFLFMSAPPILANSTGTCKQYEQECIGRTQKALFYTGMALIAVGVAGNNVSVRSFLPEQDEGTHDYGAVIGCLRIPSMIMVALVGLIGAIALPYIKPWTIRFGIPAICTAIAWLSFLTGLCCYQYNILGPERNKIGKMCRMFSLDMLPMWITFIACGIVSSTGNTYFVEQAKNLDRNLGKWKVPTQVLLLAQTWLGRLLAFVAGLIFNGSTSGVIVAKLFAVLCCTAAALIEKMRLNKVRNHSLLDSPDEDIPMSVYWLLFQFVLLGGLDSLLEKSVDEFNEDESDGEESERQWLEIFTKGVSGVGYLCSVLSVYVVGGISGNGGKPSWFQFTLNRSRLDRYYWVLAVLSGVSIVFFVVGRLCCRCRNR